MTRTAVVTGGSAGIGLATAEALAKAGWNVAIIARDAARLEEARAMLVKHGGGVLAISADVADAAAVDAAADRIERELGPIEAWVNNAMSTVVAPADRISAEEYQRVTATTYLSQVHGTLAALRHMKPRRRGAIIQVSSGLGIRAVPLQAAYCAAKFAVSGFTDALRAELIADKVPVTLTVVYLPAVNTPQPGWARNHTGREQVLPDPLFDPRVCAEAILSAIDRPEREIWVGRSTIQMAIAQSLAPGFADRQASGFAKDQLGAPASNKPGNLDEPVAGPARIDGDSTDRAIDHRLEFFTSRQRDLLKLGVGGGLAGIGALAGFGVSRLFARPNR
ncbi:MULTISPECIES: SDR family oxidoreductase [unclassified Sphingomonas]|uniref:SDR family oxidoreductase n=1 Tax=unclassified Sphingomonas TaxID=196159 RepID=UPI002854F3E2|nr:MULTISPECIES: SDR family oxidoreductase [unclassified Sphingomonas]MDR6116441.1 NAD(P)-dependent dehydrogenase (short-subunit alcohol dehydrogenase family) [Sphingomonas sp. SORGH_AS_0789]MDR6149884.1 NAD(P)-dependent dehydrogenase (short-subunit alcohol dehydrogenase family) [Sphingomonas sp. SORGH_AS_0742]